MSIVNKFNFFQDFFKVNRIRYFYGIFSELFAIVYLILHGYVIIKKRYKTPLGEIDIIAKKFNCISFIEVKSRFNEKNLEEVLTSNQVKRIKNAASLYIAKNMHFANLDISFDLIKVKGFAIHSHYKNYF